MKIETPRTEAELAELVAGAEAPLAIRGGGTRGIDVAGAPLDLSNLSGITLYEPGALTVVAQAGTPLAEIEAALEGEGQMLAFEPMDHRGLMGTDGAPTIGGVVAGNISGPRRIQGGACRDFLLGVRFVDGTGTAVKNGGRVMKNVTGYDLVKLMCGAHGTLGVLSEVSLKVLPKPEAQGTVVLSGLENADAVRAMAAALGSPFDVTGAAHDPQAGRTMIRLEGFAASVDYRAERLAALLARFGAAERVDDPALWSEIRDVAAFRGKPGDIWRVSVKPSDGPELVRRAAPEQALYDWGGGLVWLRCASGTNVRAAMGDLPGHATLVRGAGFARFHPDPAPLAAISAGLRARFDPRGVLNPGLMG
jgi:glycolate oxidase FAD binding subunit